MKRYCSVCRFAFRKTSENIPNKEYIVKEGHYLCFELSKSNNFRDWDSGELRAVEVYAFDSCNLQRFRGEK